MHLKNKKRGRKFLRSLSLILCLSLMCMPMTGMAYATELDEITEPALDVFLRQPKFLPRLGESGVVGNGGTHGAAGGNR